MPRAIANTGWLHYCIAKETLNPENLNPSNNLPHNDRPTTERYLYLYVCFVLAIEAFGSL